jgi:hypothetical protein
MSFSFVSAYLDFTVDSKFSTNLRESARHLKIIWVLLGLALWPGTLALVRGSDGASSWVWADSSTGKLAYKSLDKGDHICDFSYAGYMGGGVALPNLDVKAHVDSPSGGDDTAAIQQAIDTVSALPLVNGQRGAVLLGDGTFQCNGTLTINASGVVLRGSGLTSTALSLTGDPHPAIKIAGDGKAHLIGGESVIADDYVPSGANSFHVKEASAFHVGDTISITKPVTPDWVAFMGMDKLVRNGKPETWLKGSLETERTISSISGQTIEVDVPLTDCYDSTYVGKETVKVARISHAGPDGADPRVTQSGVENLTIHAPERHIVLGQPAFEGLQLQGLMDCWLLNVSMTGVTSGIWMKASRRVTLEKVNIDNATIMGAAKPFDISMDESTLILCDQCTGHGDAVWYAATASRCQGPNVVLNCTFKGKGAIDAHERWATGLLVDGCQVPDGSIGMHNRGEMGSGHGWTMGWGVVWNCAAATFSVQNPPGAANWQIGCRGNNITERMPTFSEEGGGADDTGNSNGTLSPGIIESQDAPVSPTSLYLAQLRQRLGDQALHNIGY